MLLYIRLYINLKYKISYLNLSCLCVRVAVYTVYGVQYVAVYTVYGVQYVAVYTVYGVQYVAVYTVYGVQYATYDLIEDK